MLTSNLYIVTLLPILQSLTLAQVAPAQDATIESLGVWDFASAEPSIGKTVGDDITKVHVSCDLGFLRSLKLKIPKALDLAVPECNQLLQAYKPLAHLSISRKTRLLYLELLPRSVTTETHAIAQSALKATFERSSENKVAYCRKAYGDKEPYISELATIDSLLSQWGELKSSASQLRFLAYDGLLGITVGPKENALELSLSATQRSLVSAKQSFQAFSANLAVAEGQRLVSAGQSLFDAIESQCLMNDRIKLYEISWRKSVSPQLTAEASLKIGRTRSDTLLAQLSSMSKDTCTVYVSSIPNAGAEVKYALPAAANKDSFKYGDISPCPIELKKDTYIFALFRASKETKRTEPVDCNMEHRQVKIQEP